MGRLPPEPGDDAWAIRFITDGRSRKASDIRRGGKAALIFQFDADDAFVALSGAATLLEGEFEVRPRWKDAYDRFFPTELDRANAAFLRANAAFLKVEASGSSFGFGVTPEPFGMQTTTLERDAAGAWRLIDGDRSDA